MTSPIVTAANSPTCVGGVGQKSPPRRPPPIARLGETTKPSSTWPHTIVITRMWHLMSSRSRRPHHGVSSHKVATKAVSRNVR